MAAVLETVVAGMRELTTGTQELTREVRTVVKQVSTPPIAFTAASPSAVDNLLHHLCLHEQPARTLPPEAVNLKPDARALIPYAWGQQSEVEASKHLLPLLKMWVTSGAIPAITNEFVDVQGLASHSPLRVRVDGIGNFSAMTDMVILNAGLVDVDVVSRLSNCAVAVDWKAPDPFRAGTKVLAALQAVAFANVQGTYPDSSPPVFFTDMVTGFRCSQIVQGALLAYHGASGTSLLSLSEGVGLIRHFLKAADTAEDAAEGAQRMVAAGAGAAAGASGPRRSSRRGRADGGSPDVGSGTGLATPPVKQAMDQADGTFDKLEADDSPETVLLEVYSREEYSPEEEAALFQSTIHRVAAHWSEMGGIRIDFCGSLSDDESAL